MCVRTEFNQVLKNAAMQAFATWPVGGHKKAAPGIDRARQRFEPTTASESGAIVGGGASWHEQS